MNRKLDVKTPGRLSYLDALKLQEETQEKRKEGTIPDTIIILEHPPVITTGRREQGHNIFVNPEKVGAELVKTNRGGEVTYHGPGQIVGYIIMDLHEYGKGIKDYISDIEEVFIRLLKNSYSIESYRDIKHRGVWVNNAKITAIGIAVNRGITMHGFAFNVNTDLSHFDWIVPCGIHGKAVTSLEKLNGESLDIEKVKDLVVKYFKEVFNYD